MIASIGLSFFYGLGLGDFAYVVVVLFLLYPSMVVCLRKRKHSMRDKQMLGRAKPGELISTRNRSKGTTEGDSQIVRKNIVQKKFLTIDETSSRKENGQKESLDNLDKVVDATVKIENNVQIGVMSEFERKAAVDGLILNPTNVVFCGNLDKISHVRKSEIIKEIEEMISDNQDVSCEKFSHMSKKVTINEKGTRMYIINDDETEEEFDEDRSLIDLF